MVDTLANSSSKSIICICVFVQHFLSLTPFLFSRVKYLALPLLYVYKLAAECVCQVFGAQQVVFRGF